MLGKHPQIGPYTPLLDNSRRVQADMARDIREAHEQGPIDSGGRFARNPTTAGGSQRGDTAVREHQHDT